MVLTAAQRESVVCLYGIDPSKITVVGAGYDSGVFKWASSKPTPSPVELVYAGKLSRAKGVPWLLRTLSTISDPPWRLHLVGGGRGEETDACLSLAQGMEPRTIVHGALTPRDLATVMRHAHVLILPSLSEGFGLVVLEGLASGCRIVATDLPAFREVLSGIEAGIVSLVKPPRYERIDQPDPGDLARFERDLRHAILEQVEAARRSPEIKSRAVRDKIESLSWSNVFDRVLHVYSPGCPAPLGSEDHSGRRVIRPVARAYRVDARPFRRRLRRIWNWLRGKRIVVTDRSRGRLRIRTGRNSATRQNGGQWFVQRYELANGLPPLPQSCRGRLEDPKALFCAERIAGDPLVRVRSWYEAKYGALDPGQGLVLVCIWDPHESTDAHTMRYGPCQVFEAEYPWLSSEYAGPSFATYFGTWYGTGVIDSRHTMDFEMFYEVYPGWKPFPGLGASWR